MMVFKDRVSTSRLLLFFFKFKINNVDMVGADHHPLPKVSKKYYTVIRW